MADIHVLLILTDVDTGIDGDVDVDIDVGIRYRHIRFPSLL